MTMTAREYIDLHSGHDGLVMQLHEARGDAGEVDVTCPPCRVVARVVLLETDREPQDWLGREVAVREVSP